MHKLSIIDAQIALRLVCSAHVMYSTFEPALTPNKSSAVVIIFFSFSEKDFAFIKRIFINSDLTASVRSEDRKI